MPLKPETRLGCEMVVTETLDAWADHWKIGSEYFKNGVVIVGLNRDMWDDLKRRLLTMVEALPLVEAPDEERRLPSVPAPDRDPVQGPGDAPTQTVQERPPVSGREGTGITACMYCEGPTVTLPAGDPTWRKCASCGREFYVVNGTCYAEKPA